MSKPHMTYRKAGVDAAAARRMVKNISAWARKTPSRGVVSGIGGFAAVFDSRKRVPSGSFIVAATDGVGTKVELAKLQNDHRTIGIDLVAMSVNDLITVGATPLFFLDYFATGRLRARQLREVMKGIAAGCRMSGCALIGGETAEMPGLYRNGSYDLAGFAVGAVRPKDLPRPHEIKAGDVLLGLPSSGVHSNGFSIVRKLFTKSKLRSSLGKRFLRPTTIYVRVALALGRCVKIKGLAHITGGGLYDNIPRILPEGLGVKIQQGSWPVQKIFSTIQHAGRMKDKEMFRTFNMGIGMVAVVKAGDASKARLALRRAGMRSWIIGYVCKGKGVRII